MSGTWSNQRVDLILLQEDVSGFSGLFGYSPSIGAGNLVLSVAAVAGVDPYGNAYPAGFSTLVGNSTIQGSNYLLNSSGLFIYNQATAGPTVLTFTAAGTSNWTAPAGVSVVLAECWGSGGGGAGADSVNQAFSGGAGAGEYAAEPALAVTAGNSYAYTIGAAGSGGAFQVAGQAGGNTTMAGDSVTVTAHGGAGGPLSAGSAAGGSGSTNTTHFSGGAGGTITSGTAGSGGGSSGGTASAGNPGASSGAGGAAVSGGGPGGNGGAGTAGSSPSGGPGGGGGAGGCTGSAGNAGAAGAAGQVRLTYTPATSGLALIASICGVATLDPVLGVSCPEGASFDHLMLSKTATLANQGSAPAAVAASAVLYGSGGQLAQVAASGVQTQVPGTQLATFPGTTVTAASLTTLATSTTIYLAGDAQAGSVYELEVTGNGTWGSTAQTLELAVVFGGTTMATVTIGATQFSASQAFRWKARVRVICHTTGSSGTWTSEIDGIVSVFNANILGGIGANGTAPFTSSESTGTTTVNTTANQTLSLAAAWGSTTGAPTLTSRVVLARKVN